MNEPKNKVIAETEMVTVPDRIIPERITVEEIHCFSDKVKQSRMNKKTQIQLNKIQKKQFGVEE